MIDTRLKQSERVRLAVAEYQGKEEFSTTDIAKRLGARYLAGVAHHLTQMWGNGELAKRKDRLGRVKWRRKAVRRKAQ